ncbi:hypothetical protein LCGC14_3035470, partial [marine sediment metagenome]
MLETILAMAMLAAILLAVHTALSSGVGAYRRCRSRSDRDTMAWGTIRLIAGDLGSRRWLATVAGVLVALDVSCHMIDLFADGPAVGVAVRLVIASHAARRFDKGRCLGHGELYFRKGPHSLGGGQFRFGYCGQFLPAWGEFNSLYP